MEVKKIVEGMTAQQVAQVIDDNFKAQNKILEEDIAKQNNVIGVSEYKDFSEAEAVNAGDVRKYNGFLYECVEDTTGAFDASKWKKSSFKKEMEEKLSGLTSFSRNRATGLLFGEMEMTISKGNCNFIFNVTASSCFIYHESGYYTTETPINKNFTLGTELSIIYYDNSVKDILRATNINDVPLDAVVLEVFYSYLENVVKVAWSSPFIEKVDFKNYDSHCSFANPNEINELHDLVIGKDEKSTTYEDVPNHSTRSLIFSAKKDSTIRISYESENVTSCVLGVDFTDGTFHYSIASIKSGGYYDYKAEKDVRSIAFYTNSAEAAIITVKAKIIGLYTLVDNNSEKIRELEEKSKSSLPKVMSAKIFQRVGCIGDSYTAGYIKTSKNFSNESEKYAWPHYMEGLTNNKYDNWGVSGSTAKGWVLGAAKLNEVKAEGNKCQAYVIGLMINDRSNASWNNYYTPVGTYEDIGTDADSYYAYYYKLIQEVVSVNSEAFIFCNTCPKWDPTDAYNVAVKDVVRYCKTKGQKVYLCDIADDKYAEYYDNDLFAEDFINGHYSAIGYEYMAECYVHVMSDVINSNIKDFQDVAFIPFDLSE